MLEESSSASKASAIKSLLERSRLSNRPIVPRPVSESVKRIVRSEIFERFLQLLTLAPKRRKQLNEVGLSDSVIDFLLIRDCPPILVNLSACDQVVSEFGDITDCSGFYRNEFANIVFDVDERLANVDFLCAERGLNGLIIAIRLFRSLQDSRSFRVETRRKVVSA